MTKTTRKPKDLQDYIIWRRGSITPQIAFYAESGNYFFVYGCKDFRTHPALPSIVESVRVEDVLKWAPLPPPSRRCPFPGES